MPTRPGKIPIQVQVETAKNLKKIDATSTYDKIINNLMNPNGDKN